MVAGACRVATSCTQVELTLNWLLTAKLFFYMCSGFFNNFKRNFLTGLLPTESTLRNGSFSAIMRHIWTALDTQFQKQATITAERAKIIYAYYTILFNAVCHCSIKATMMMMTIQHEGRRHIDCWQMSISPGQTMVNTCKTAFSPHVVESASDDYNF